MYKILSDSVQEFNGKKYHKGTNDYFYKTLGATDKKIKGKSRESIHRETYEFHNGSIMSGYVVHHIDHNKSNNDISNLKLMKNNEHQSEHAKQFHKDNPEHSKKTIEANQDKCREWHKSEDGKKWHKEHFKNHGHKMYKKITILCEVCGEFGDVTFSGGKGNKYCSRKCNSKARRDSGIDNEDRKCAYCDELFSVNKYSKAKYCSTKCSALQREDNKRKQIV